MISVIETIQKYLSLLVSEAYPRYQSWDHCYKAFQASKMNEHHSLHLGFYLASWGMYRGSAGLLQKNHKVHDEAVKRIYEEVGQKLKCSKLRDVRRSDIDDIIKFGNVLKSYYKAIDYTRGPEPAKKISATQTLFSKIMLGTLACAPAYDQYFCRGLEIYGIKKRTFTKASLEELFDFYDNHDNEFQSAQQTIMEKIGLHYPIMKIMDMYFWQIGYDDEMKKVEEKKNKANQKGE